MHLMSEWIPGSEMPEDEWSRERVLQDQDDCALSPSCYQYICHCQQLACNPTLDLFALRLNRKCKRYYAAPPPPNLVTKVLKTLRQDKATVLSRAALGTRRSGTWLYPRH